jgi:hypothetical protein
MNTQLSLQLRLWQQQPSKQVGPSMVSCALHRVLFAAPALAAALAAACTYARPKQPQAHIGLHSSDNACSALSLKKPWQQAFWPTSTHKLHALLITPATRTCCLTRTLMLPQAACTCCCTPACLFSQATCTRCLQPTHTTGIRGTAGLQQPKKQQQ